MDDYVINQQRDNNSFEKCAFWSLSYHQI